MPDVKSCKAHGTGNDPTAVKPQLTVWLTIMVTARISYWKLCDDQMRWNIIRIRATTWHKQAQD